MQHGCSSYLTYVVDTQFEGNKSGSNVPVVKEFTDVISEDLPGVPLVRQVEFRINLISAASLIAKEPYHLVPREMQEFSYLLHELLDKQFIRPSSSPWGPPILFVKKKDNSH